jgi:hypothetical protein
MRYTTLGLEVCIVVGSAAQYIFVSPIDKADADGHKILATRGWSKNHYQLQHGRKLLLPNPDVPIRQRD